jgi:hypothetical protein
MFTRRFPIWILLLLAAGCDRIEGKALDLKARAGAAAQGMLVSDVQRSAEALCSSAVTGWRTPEQTSISGKFEPVSSSPPEVQVYGDGKYKISLAVNRTEGVALPSQGGSLLFDASRPSYRGDCSVENGTVISAKVVIR